MKHSDFKLGTEFTTDNGRRWKVTDIGTRTIIAIMIDHVQIGGVLVKDGLTEPFDIEIISSAEAKAKGWFNGPPYALSENVFNEDDIESCNIKDP